MAGNVWEWVYSLENRYPYKPNDDRETDIVKNENGTYEAVNYRIIRGGSYINDEWSLRCTVLSQHGQNERAGYLGFRICLAPPLPK